MSVLHLADPQSLADLGRYATRVRGLDPQGSLRLQGHGRVLAAWSCPRPGTGLSHEGLVLALRTYALGEDSILDVTVRADEIPERTVEPQVERDLFLPAGGPAPAWTALTPPRGGWEPLGTVPGDGLVEMAQGTRERLSVRDDTGGVATVLTRIVGVAAYGLGFLTPGCEVPVHRSGAWTRLAAPAGYVLIR